MIEQCILMDELERLREEVYMQKGEVRSLSNVIYTCHQRAEARAMEMEEVNARSIKLTRVQGDIRCIRSIIEEEDDPWIIKRKIYDIIGVSDG